jgi:hypothetical protein
MKRIAIMQPYYLPYIGYFQLINAVEEFVVYDNIQYTKKGWVNRNRYLSNGKDVYFTIPLKKDSDYLNISERQLANGYKKLNEKQLRKIQNAYRKAPYFNDVMPLLSDCFLYNNDNLFNFILNSIYNINNFIGIETKITISSSIDNANEELKATERVKNICKLLLADSYLNPIGGIELYDKSKFKQCGIQLNFLKTIDFQYIQFNNDFIPFLSIVDVLMFNSLQKVRDIINAKYEFV